MRLLASYILRGPMQAILVAAVCAIVSMLWPPLTWVLAYVSGAAVALVTLQVGARQGLLVTAGAVVGAAGIAFLVMREPLVGVGFTLMLWLPVWAVCLMLRKTQSLPLALEGATALGLVGVVIAFLILGNPAPLWLQLLNTMKSAFVEAGFFANPDQATQAMKMAANVMTGSAAAYLVLGLILSVMLGRSWQALLYNPSGFAEEFRKLRLDRVTAFATLAVVALASFAKLPIAANLMIVLGMAYVFYGLAVVHGFVAAVGANMAWLVGLYVLMALKLPYMAMLLALVGFADTWLDFRSRVRQK